MLPDRPVGWVVAAVTSGVITLVAASVVFVNPTGAELLSAVMTVWVPLLIAFRIADADPAHLSRFTILFCGSLVGLTLLVSPLLGGAVLNAVLYGLSAVDLAVGINPVMAVLVGGAIALAYYGVFEWGDGDGKRAA